MDRPIPSTPPRSPGEVLERQANEKFAYRWFFASGVTTGLVLAAALLWLNHLAGTGWALAMLSAVALIAVLWMFVEYRRLGIGILPLLRGALGEREVGALLDDMRSKGYRVFHQVPIPVSNGKFIQFEDGSGYAADHVLVGPAGVFVIETKRRSEKNGQPRRVVYDFAASRVLVNGYWDKDNCPLRQVKGYATGLGKHLRQHTQSDVYVRGVLVYPGADVVTRSGSGADGRTWVLVPRKLPSWLRQEIKRPFGGQKLPLTEFQIDRLASEVAALGRK